ncbi:MAG: AMP-binding protein [Chloroflexi bacterium]|nr:AMP-binding protein [Chloroflexota bacterium]
MDSIYPVFENSANKNSNRPCLIYLSKQYTYAQLKDAVDNTAASLVTRGISAGTKAILFMPNLPQWIIAWLALQKIGAVAVPITPFYALNDLKYIANDSGAEAIFCLDTNYGYVERVLSETRLKQVIVTTMIQVLPMWKQLLGRALNKVPEGKVRLGGNVIAFSELWNGQKNSTPLPHPSCDLETAELLYTGGTTGHPKGVPISHTLFLEAMREQRKARESINPIGEDVIVQGAPLYHILGQAVGLGALLHGDTIILLPRVNLDATFDHIQRHRATTFFGVPTMYRMILEHDRIDQYDLSSLKYCFSGGDVLPAQVGRRWQKKFGKPIYQGYGATETCGGISLTPAVESFPEGTAGKVVAFQKVKLVNPDTLESVADGESGELLVSSDHMVSAYWNKPEESAKCFVKIDGRLWYRTGDVLQIDQEGWFFFQDRSVDVIKHKGYRVAASRVESVLQENPAVIASCVVGIPDETVGERIKAFVVLKEGVKGVTAYDLTAWCRSRLAAYEVPHYIEFRDMLPKSKVGKLLRRELRAEERRKTEN